MTATKYKKKAKEADRSDDIEVEIKPTKVLKLKKQTYTGLVYENPLSILIRFEAADHARTIKLMNKTSKSFTYHVNTALKEYLIKNKIK